MQKVKNVLFLIIFCLIMMNCSEKTSAGLEKGDKAPHFSAHNQNGKQWSTTQYYGKNNLIIYFYPAAMTGGCTKQACSYRDNSQQIKKYDAKIIGISGDRIKNLKIFQEENSLNFTLLSDPDGIIAEKFGVPTSEGGKIIKKINGKEVELTRESTLQRWTFLINKKGRIAYKDTSVNVTKDSQNIIKMLKKLEQ